MAQNQLHKGRSSRRWLSAACLIVSSALCPSRAELIHVDVISRDLVLDSHSFAPADADSLVYERLSGRLLFEFDPGLEANRAIVDLSLAPRNERGRVEAEADFMVLQPVDPALRSGTGLLEVSNRGRKASLSYFQSGAGQPKQGDYPVTAEHFGDGLLMRRGWTLIWVGWQADVPQGLLQMRSPIAVKGANQVEEVGSEAGSLPAVESIVGLVRCDWVVDEPVSKLELGHRDHIPYAIADREHPDCNLTYREGRLSERFEVARESWAFSESGTSIVAQEEPFQAGRIYELVYRAKDPHLVGLGLAIVRDTMSYAKFAEEPDFPVKNGLAVGISQTGRFLRHFLFEGFNGDELGRAVFDGLLVHSAGAGRGSFNHRFAQPSRDAHRYSAFFYPTDLFPFSGRRQRDPLLRNRAGGLLDKALKAGHLPKIFYTNTGYEYWGRAAALLHVSVDGAADVEPLECERIYHLASGQHYVNSASPDPRTNSLDFKVSLRALLVALEEWTLGAAEPPPSRYPRIDRGDLVSLEEWSFPRLPDLVVPNRAHEAYRVDYGSEWDQGVIALQPPRLGQTFPVLVPKVDELGNELGGVPHMETLVPLGTYTPWRVRANKAGGNGELEDFVGNFLALPGTRVDALNLGDPRVSREERYPFREAFGEAVERAADELERQRFLLPQDRERVITKALGLWDRLNSSEPDPVEPTEPAVDEAVEGGVAGDDGEGPAEDAGEDAGESKPIEAPVEVGAGSQ